MSDLDFSLEKKAAQLPKGKEKTIFN